MSTSSNHPKKAQIDRATQERIGSKLRAMYSELLRDPLPAKLLVTLQAIEQAEEGTRRDLVRAA
jgi:hypothetical protein